MLAEVEQYQLTYSQLIEKAIGEHGVDFQALRLLLQNLVVKIGISEELVETRSLWPDNAIDETEKVDVYLDDEMRLKGGADDPETVEKAQEISKLSNDIELEEEETNDSNPERRLNINALSSSEVSIHTTGSPGSSEINFFEHEIVVTTSESASFDMKSVRPTYGMTSGAFSADLRLRFDLFEHEIKQMIEERLNFYNRSMKEYIDALHKPPPPAEGSLSLSNETKEGMLVSESPYRELEEVKGESSQHESLVKSAKYAISVAGENIELLKMRRDIYDIFAKVDCISEEILTLGKLNVDTELTDIRKDLLETKKAVNTNISTIMDIVRRLNSNMISIHVNKQKIADILTNKVSKSEYEMAMAEKVDYNYVRRKASLADLQDLYAKCAAEVCDARKLTVDTEKNIIKYIDGVEARFGTRTVNDKLLLFNKEMQAKIAEIRAECLELWQKSQECAAGGIRQLPANCLSCGSRCAITNNTHKKLPLRDAYRTPTIAPIVTLQVSTLHKGSDKVGYIEQNKRSFGSMKINTKYNSKCMT